ncbi:MAG TPA: hypothetical protein VE868_00160 [Balneolaceae bacterium]|nr:hypothetical protein [Balneolaceae bacterium]
MNKSEFGIKWMVLIPGVTFERAKVTKTRRLMKKEQISILLLLNKAVHLRAEALWRVDTEETQRVSEKISP